MSSQGWIKLHRQLRENPIYKSSTAVHCWIECLLRAIHTDDAFFLKRQKQSLKPGQFCMGRDEFGISIGISGSTAWFWINQFYVDGMIDIKTSNVGTVVTVLKWKDYQGLDSEVDNRKTTDEQRMNTNKNDKNDKNDEIVSKDTMVKDRDQVIDFILDEFKKRFGAYPIDRKPRQVAYNVRQLATSFVKKYGDGYEKLRGTKLDVRSTILRAYDIYQQKESSQNVEYLDTFKRHMKKIFELTVAQMIKDGIIIS